MRRALLVFTTMTTAAALALPAAGADGSTFADAAAAGLELTVAGQGLTVGASQAHAQTADREGGCEPGISVCAVGAGALGLSESATASAPGNPGPNQATAFALPEGMSPLLTGALGVASASASEAPLAASGAGAALDLAVTATRTLAENVPVQDALDQFNDQVLRPIAANDPSGLAARLSDSVAHISENLAVAPLVTVAAGVSRSDIDALSGTTTATGTSAGATIVFAPTPSSLPGAPDGLVIVDVGAARATASNDGLSATASFDPALVRLRAFDPATGTYDPDIAIAPGQSRCVLEGTPLQVCVAVGAGSSSTENGVATAAATGVTIEALTDPLPAVRLALASASAQVAATVATPPAQPPVDPLPLTGGGATGAALAVLGAGAALAGQRRRARAAA